MSLIDAGKEIIEKRLKARKELEEIKHKAYNDALKGEVVKVMKEKAREDAEAHKYSVREKVKHALLKAVNEKKKSKKSILFDKDDDSLLSPQFKEAFDKK